MNRRKRRPAWTKLVAAAMVVAALAAAWRYTPLADYLSPQRIAEWSRIARKTPWAPVVLIFAFTPAAFALFPRPLLTLVAVIAFGAWRGSIYSAAGILGAALATYYAGRLIPRRTLVRLAGTELDDAGKLLRRHGVLSIFAANMVPVPPFVVQGMIAGAVRIRLRDYTLGSLLGMAPGLFGAAVFGGQIATALEDPAGVSYWLIGGAGVALLAFGYFFRRWASKQDSG